MAEAGVAQKLPAVHNAAAVVAAGQYSPLRHAIWLDVLEHMLPAAHAAAAVLAVGQ